MANSDMGRAPLISDIQNTNEIASVGFLNGTNRLSSPMQKRLMPNAISPHKHLHAKENSDMHPSNRKKGRSRFDARYPETPLELLRIEIPSSIRKMIETKCNVAILTKPMGIRKVYL
jgi:hypothetical protein